MTVHKIGQIEVFEIDQNIDEYTRKEREQFINELFKQEYQGKEIKYLLNGDEINALINNTTKHNFRSYQHSGKYENKKGFKTRQDIAFSGDYLNLIEDMSYDNTKLELKIGQNKYHQKNNKWHYFTKTILCNQKIYTINLDILEKNKKYYIYSINAKEVESLAKCQRLVSTSFINNISQINEDIKGKYILNREWIDDDLFKVVIKNPKNPFYVEAVCKTVKKKIEYYITNGQHVYPIQKGDIEKEALNLILETIENETGITEKSVDETLNR